MSVSDLDWDPGFGFKSGIESGFESVSETGSGSEINFKPDPDLNPDPKLLFRIRNTRLFLLGHLGHIILPLPVVNPMFYINIQRLLKVTCIHCHRWGMPCPSSLGIVLGFGTGTVLFLLNMVRF